MKKLTNKKGFTLMEMLIVVAIIVILVAVSVPTLTANLNESRKATDDANMRAAKSAAIVYMMDNAPATGSLTVYYDANAGKIVPEASKPSTGYGQYKVSDTEDHTNKVIKVVYTAPATEGAEPTYTYTWE